MLGIDNRLRDMLRSGKPLYGIGVGIPEPALVEMVGYAGYDYVVVDNEHGPASIERTEHMFRAARCAGIPPVARIIQEADILRYLDIGASGIQMPMIETAEQAERVVAACRYYPEGNRGAAFSTRAAGYGFMDRAEHVKRSNEGVAVILMIETKKGVDNLDDILKVKGIDCVLLGATDLSFSLGHPNNAKHPVVQEVIRDCTARILAAGIAPGGLAMNGPDCQEGVKLGMRYMTGLMSMIIGKGLRSTLAELKGT